ncbi:S-acyltransferase 13 [Seminavis robusta]|uniref:Palmitoyltransferase n=1 Tax=Seminavis robusta TaxID=568900 RepID=A0A9N8EY24_9STRA|nr:S-acyltransferase 13 [Seminavis robusta]|eukprot:Sro2062_g313050.1 S-acyltransferase 13 (420) ;mRNA; r:8548-10092
MSGRADCFKIGTSFTARRWLSLNPCGCFGITCSFAVHIFAATVTGMHLIEGSFLAQAVYILVYLPLSFLALWSLFMAWTTNPGAVPMGARPLVTLSRAASGEMSPSAQARKRGIRRCQKCNDNYKPDRAHHDSVTGRCIVKFDHYCPWVCNAVGALNHKFFVLFVFYTMTTCMTSIFMIITRAVRCGYVRENPSGDASEASMFAPNATQEEEEIKEEEKEGDLDEGRGLLRGLQSLAPTYVHEECEDFHQTYTVVILFCVAVTFMIFTACMMIEQIEAIQTNQGKIARMKMRVGQGGTELTRVTEAFNEMFGGTSPKASWHWFVPLPVRFPTGMHKVVMGYEWDPTFDPVPFRDDRPDAGSEGTSTSDEPTSATEGTSETPEEPPVDVETGLSTPDLDEVAIDAPQEKPPAPGRLKKRL